MAPTIIFRSISMDPEDSVQSEIPSFEIAYTSPYSPISPASSPQPQVEPFRKQCISTLELVASDKFHQIPEENKVDNDLTVEDFSKNEMDCYLDLEEEPEQEHSHRQWDSAADIFKSSSPSNTQWESYLPPDNYSTPEFDVQSANVYRHKPTKDTFKASSRDGYYPSGNYSVSAGDIQSAKVYRHKPTTLNTNTAFKAKSRKRFRINYSQKQLDVLREQYSKGRFVCPIVRNELAERLELSEKQINVWFQNCRSKEKKNGIDASQYSPISPASSDPSTPDSGLQSHKLASPIHFQQPMCGGKPSLSSSWDVMNIESDGVAPLQPPMRRVQHCPQYNYDPWLASSVANYYSQLSTVGTSSDHLDQTANGPYSEYDRSSSNYYSNRSRSSETDLMSMMVDVSLELSDSIRK